MEAEGAVDGGEPAGAAGCELEADAATLTLEELLAWLALYAAAQWRSFSRFLGPFLRRGTCSWGGK